MANRAELTDHEWNKLFEILLSHNRVYVGTEERMRQFMNGVLWILRSGAQWRLLPKHFGKWNTVFKRFSRWCEWGIWEEVYKACMVDPDLQQVLIDSTVVRANACAAGAAGSTAVAEALGRSKGGFGTKIHAVTDALGNPLAFSLTGGEASDIGQAAYLLELTPEGAEAMVGDKGYDCGAFVQAIEARNMQAVIPPRSNRKERRLCDWFVYKERHLVECFFNKIKFYRRVFSRFDKKAKNFMGFLHFVSALIWLR